MGVNGPARPSLSHSRLGTETENCPLFSGQGEDKKGARMYAKGPLENIARHLLEEKRQKKREKVEVVQMNSYK